jgi:hypothetical protein
MAIGIILLIIGGLAQYIGIPPDVAVIIKNVGSVQLGVVIFMRIARQGYQGCSLLYNKLRVNINWEEFINRMKCEEPREPLLKRSLCDD